MFYILLFIASIFIASFSQVILKKGAAVKNIYINKYTIVGYTLMLISTVFTLVGYRGVELTLGAVLQSLSFVFVPFFSYFLLKEKLDKRTVLGITVIIIGIIIFSI